MRLPRTAETTQAIWVKALAAGQRLNERKWGPVWECDQLLNLVDAFEKSARVPGP